jgi:hypothetical protein
MLSNKVALGVLGVLALVGAAGAGAYIATHRAATEAPAAVVPPSTTPVAGGAVEATEAVMDEKPAATDASGTGQSGQEVQTPQAPEHVDRQPARSRRPATPPTAEPVDRPSAPAAARPSRRDPVTAGSPVAASRTVPAAAPLPVSPEPPTTLARAERPPVDPVAELPPAPQYLEVTVPSDAVVGLQIETAVSSETARVEDRVVARVTRDVRADGRVAIPAGSKVIGAVSIVERGGRMKDQAKLGVRFHTVILADGTELPLQTETIYRVGEAPGNASAAKVGGGAIGGAILGAILGGGKGAAIGGAIGAAGGTAAVMASDRHPAVLAAGSPITVKVLSPVTVTVEKE